MKASGTFTVRLDPLDAFCKAEPGIMISRMSIEKNFEGDLSAVSTGDMLSAVTRREGSAGYVAIEQLSGSLHGREGTFVLQHFGIMNRGAGRLTLEIVPDSGSGELEGIAGTMQIEVENGVHSYELQYSMQE